MRTVKAQLFSSVDRQNARDYAGDFAREFILDKPMLERAELSGAAKMLDIGCGEGRFCRMAKEIGIDAVGIDPIEPFIERAQKP